MKHVPMWSAVSLLACSCTDSDLPLTFQKPAAIQAATMAQDWRNAPEWENYVDYTYAVLSPRAQLDGGPVGGAGTPAAEELIAHGVKALFMIRPCYQKWQGESLPEGDFNRAIQDLAASYHAELPTLEGSTFEMPDECFAVDFRNRPFTNALADYFVEHLAVGSGILHHEACGRMDYYETGDQISDATWEAWQEGFFYYVRKLRTTRPDWEFIGVCDRWDTASAEPGTRNYLYDGLFFEQMGSSLNPVGPKVFNELSAGGTRNVVALDEVTSWAPRRWGAAAMALVKDAIFLYGAGATVTKDMEHFEIYYGTFPGAAEEISPGVWERVGTHGLVVFNESGAPYTYTDPIRAQSFSLLDGDGLSAQFKDTSTGADLTDWITNYGK
ncbi:MAG: hypothetical protein V1798_06900 [Pseudomonadota bacterium]